ncbi:uncharacterized protein LOC143663328 [Tamandua tetradactyla]|uniref:uncharacterized protein LOC143663328 n=1 Tax=Tamandua tetradactyla TaxID=48850 RepID=UPI00405471CC
MVVEALEELGGAGLPTPPPLPHPAFAPPFSLPPLPSLRPFPSFFPTPPSALSPPCTRWSRGCSENPEPGARRAAGTSKSGRPPGSRRCDPVRSRRSRAPGPAAPGAAARGAEARAPPPQPQRTRSGRADGTERRPRRARVMQRDCGRATVPTDFLLPPPNVVYELPPGASVIHICGQDLDSLPRQHVVLASGEDPKEQDTEEPKKRKGGWPKGKKRKTPRDLPIPRAPTTGYVIFLNEQRSQLRARHPQLPFTEITKMLAAQWAQLSHERKQLTRFTNGHLRASKRPALYQPVAREETKPLPALQDLMVWEIGTLLPQRYVYQADEDKQRYIRELQAYQSSEAYRAFLQRRAAHKAQAVYGTGAPGSGFESDGLDFSAVDGDGGRDLYCRTCRQFFSSLHNKKEHLLGKQHLQNLTGEFEKDSAEYSIRLESPEEEGQNLNKGESNEEADCPHLPLLRGLIPEKSFASLDLCFLQEFIFKLLKIKEFEFRELQRTLERAQAEQDALQRQLVEFQNQQQRLEVELAGLKTYGIILEREFENLNMVLLLSHVGLHAMDTA